MLAGKERTDYRSRGADDLVVVESPGNSLKEASWDPKLRRDRSRNSTGQQMII